MPKIYRRRRPAARKPRLARRRSAAPRRRTRVPRAMSMSLTSLQPVKRVLTLRYTQIQPLNRNLASTTYSSYYFSCNSIFDPDQTASGAPGHQPFYFDQLTALYKRYSVLSSTCTCTAVSGGPFMLFGRVESSYSVGGPTSFGDSFSQADLERPGTVKRMCVAARPGTVTLRWNCKRATFTRDDNTGIMGNAGTGSDPAYQDYFRFGANTLVPGGAEGTSAFGSSILPSAIISMTFKVLFTEPVDIGMS